MIHNKYQQDPLDEDSDESTRIEVLITRQRELLNRIHNENNILMGVVTRLFGIDSLVTDEDSEIRPESAGYMDDLELLQYQIKEAINYTKAIANKLSSNI